ncbi:MAG TPA: DNA double-strand break repair nuclease NurA [Anaerolineales bacterium]|nr:DNA double-strand break repair nuclease NurA [Anaerolineales bacterium]
MPINYQETYKQIKEIGEGAHEKRKKKEEIQTLARNLLDAYASQLDLLRSKVDSAKKLDANIRCAYPLDEPLDSHIAAPVSTTDLTVIAADGSQIIPDRHAANQYFVINVGAIVMQNGSGKTPEVSAETKIQLLDEFDDTFFSESQIALQRDVAERRKLLEMSKEYSGTIIALTEGQLELWGSSDNDNAREFEKSLQDYLDVLGELEKLKIITSGFVDKPGANWVLRMLEIMTTPMDQLKESKKYRPLLGATDRWLFSQILGKHERSAVFALQAKSAEKYKDLISIHFFYLNVGDEKKPKIARVDVPLWVVNKQESLNDLHCALIEQVKIMGNEPFPYLLHRAHEIAVVTHREKEEIDQMLALAIRNNGGEVGDISGKQSAKNLPGRIRR